MNRPVTEHKLQPQGTFPNHSSSSCSDFLFHHRLESVPEDVPWPAESPGTVPPYLLERQSGRQHILERRDQPDPPLWEQAFGNALRSRPSWLQLCEPQSEKLVRSGHFCSQCGNASVE